MKPGSVKHLISVVLPPVVLLAALLAAWTWMSAQGMIPNYLLPSPGKLAGALVGDRSVLLRHGLATTEEALTGYVIGSVLGLLAAVVLSFSRHLRACFFPLALATQAIPIIAVTSYALAGDEAKALAAGCNAYVTKPFSPRALLAKVREYLD